VSSLDWDAHWTSKQQIVHRLAAKNRILYIEEPVTMLAPLKERRYWKRWRAVWPRLRAVEPGLWALTLPPLLPFGNLRRGINRANQWVISRYIRRAVCRLGLTQYLLWSYLPTAADLLDFLEPVAVVYHCVDEYSAFPGFVNPKTVRGYDERLSRRADVVICTAENLRRSRAGWNPHTYHVPNAADVQHFKQALDPALPLPADVAALPRPRIGLIGVMDERFDVEAIRVLAEADPTWSVVLVGPIRPGDVDVRVLERLPNVHMLGNKPVKDLPAYAKALDVALIPYRAMELTRNIFPLKLFEYLAAGLPVVVGGLPELEKYRGTIMIADSPADYPVLVQRALTEDTLERRKERVRLAEENSWEHRVEEISSLVEAMLERKGLK
ncbi:MAG: glycosyltransferase, partial [Thermoleophilia bacterium]|nr:glycosyltransferase [Thermoleophilia bacterium]